MAVPADRSGFGSAARGRLTSLALVAACLCLALAGCGSSGSEQAHVSVVAPEEATMSKAEIAKLPPLKIPRASGSPPHRLQVVDLREGSGPVVTKTGAVSIRFIEDTYPEALAGVQGGLSGGVVHWHDWSLEQASRGIAMGLPGMRVGGRRELIVPPKVAYPRWQPSWGYAPYVSVYVVDLFGSKTR